MAVGDRDSLEAPVRSTRPTQPSLSPMQSGSSRQGASDRDGATETRRDSLTPMTAIGNPVSSPDSRQEAAATTIQRAFRAHKERAAASRAGIEARHETPPSTKLQEPERPAADPASSAEIPKDFIGFTEGNTFQTPVKIGPFNIVAQGTLPRGVAKRHGLENAPRFQPSEHAEQAHAEQAEKPPRRKFEAGQLHVGGLFGPDVLAKMAKRAQAQQSRAAAAKAKSEADKPSTHTPPSSSGKSGGEKGGH